MSDYKYTPDISYKINKKIILPGLVYLFPGQGSAKPKMFDNFLEDDVFKKYINLANEFLSKKKKVGVSSYLAGQKIDEKDLALVRNMALFSCEVSLFFKVSVLFPPKKLIGHSFGEFAALVCCGALSFEEGLEFVYLREFSCPNESHGGMLVIGKIETNLQKIDQLSELYLANINSYNQRAYSFKSNDLNIVSHKLRRLRVPFVHLYNLKFPYHSDLMKEARDNLKGKLKEMNFSFSSELTCSFYSTVTNKDYKNIAELKEDVHEILSEQLVRSVDFVEAIEHCFLKEEFSFFECGPDNTLEIFTKNIYKEKKRLFEFFFHTLPKSLNQRSYSPKLLKSKWFKSLGNILTEVTGYKIKELDVHYDFQKDLGIDSIKKAEVLYKTLNAQKIESVDQISLSSFKTVGEFVEYMEKYGDEAQELDDNKKEELVFSTYEIHQEKNLHQYPCLLASAKRLSLFSLMAKSNVKEIFIELKKILLDIKGKDFDELNLILPIDDALSYGVASFVKSFVRDESFSLCIHYVEKEEQTLFHSGDIENYYSTQIQSAELKKDIFKKVMRENQLNQINQKKSPRKIVFIGAHKGLGRYLNEHSLFLKECQIVILGRSLENKTQGRIQYKKIDITQFEALDKALMDLGPIDLLINAAGIEISKSLEETTLEDFEIVNEVKFSSAIHLADFCEKTLKCPYVQFSSIVGYFGGRGQYTYAFANEMTRQGLREHHGKNLIINWPALDRLGMTENLGIYQRLKESGVSMLMPKDAVILFDNILEDFFGQDLTQDYFLLTQRDFYILDHHLTRADSFKDTLLKSIGGHKFQKQVDLEKSASLKDHCVNQIYVYPASFLLEDSFKLLYQTFRRLQIGTAHFQFDIQNVSLFHQGKIQQDFSLIDDQKSLGVLAVKSNLVDYATLSLKNSFAIGQEIPRHDFSLTLVLSSLYNENVISFGPHFQMAQKLMADEKKENCLITGVYQCPWQLLEAGFQGVSVLCGANGGGLAVPQSIEGLKVDMKEFLDVSGKYDYKIYSHLVSKKNQNVIGSFSIFKNDKCIIQCQDLKLTIVRMFRKELLIFNN